MFYSENLRIEKLTENTWRCFEGEHLLGEFSTAHNIYHAGNVYVTFNFSSFNPVWAEPLFRELRCIFSKPLQVMTYSDNRELVQFLEAGGCVRKRRCCEMEVERAELRCLQARSLRLERAEKGSLEYRLCCELLYAYYTFTHAPVSPLTADYEVFCELVPHEVFYQRRNGVITQAVFTDGCELAYFAENVRAPYERQAEADEAFAEAVVQQLFALYDKLYFECDDCDPLACRFKNIFDSSCERTFDTWIFDAEL